MNPSDIHQCLEGVWRIEAARIIASVARIVHDIGIAEEMAQDAVLSALETWPQNGIPENPAAWLMTAAKNRAIDLIRHQKLSTRKHQEISQTQENSTEMNLQVLDDNIDDDMLRLIFTACHPVLSADARIALTLRLIGGLSTDEIARAFVLSETTIAQRITRAKRTLSAAKVPFEMPHTNQRAERLSSVLEVVYLIFNEGYSATAGEDWMRPALCEEAVRLGRVLAELAPQEPEVLGLAALMELQSSRLPARTTADGEPILLLEQNRARWDQLLIRRGLALLQRAFACKQALGFYTLQAAIAACHARATSAEQTEWEQIAALYDALAQVSPSPVIELNRAVAVAMTFGAQAGLEIIEPLTNKPELSNYHLLFSVRGDFLEKLGRYQEARQAFKHAAVLTANIREKTLMLSRAKQCHKACNE